jgi:hypothetical protein
VWNATPNFIERAQDTCAPKPMIGRIGQNERVKS